MDALGSNPLLRLSPVAAAVPAAKKLRKNRTRHACHHRKLIQVTGWACISSTFTFFSFRFPVSAL
jgi:hypothetical protein